MKLDEALNTLKESGYVCESLASSRMKMAVKQILASKYKLTSTEIALATIDEDDQIEEAAEEGISPASVAEAIYNKFMEDR